MQKILKLPPGKARTRNRKESEAPFWVPHPMIREGPADWIILRMWGPRSMQQLVRLQRFQDDLAKEVQT